MDALFYKQLFLYTKTFYVYHQSTNSSMMERQGKTHLNVTHGKTLRLSQFTRAVAASSGIKN